MAEDSPLDNNTRRTVLAGAGVVGLAGVLAACGSNSNSDTGSDPASDGSNGSSGSGAGSGSGSGSGGASDALAKTSEIPVGGGKVFSGKKVVVTQPTAGEFKAFTAVCTHQGCTVGTVSNGTINCPCHGSKFSVKDGSVVNGPATQPLAEQKLSRANGEIKLG